MTSGIELSIVIPCLDEEETVGQCVAAAVSYVRGAGIEAEVIVADNGSSDASRQVAERAGARVVSVTERGYGSAVRGGAEASLGCYVIMGDADSSYDFADCAPIIERLRAGDDLVIGNRFAGGIERGAMPLLHRFGTPFLGFLARRFSGSAVRDVTSGLRGFTREAYRRMALQATGMELAAEMVMRAGILGLSVSEVPIRLRRDGRSGPPHLRTWRDGWRSLRLMLLFSPDWLFVYPGFLAMATGLALSLSIIPGPLLVYGIGFDVQTLLYSFLLMLVGFKSLVFGVITSMLSVEWGYLPGERDWPILRRRLCLEAGVVLGALLVAVGLAGSVVALAGWGRAGFGALEVRSSMRMVIPSIFSIALGCEIVLASFFLGVLGLERFTRDPGE